MPITKIYDNKFKRKIIIIAIFLSIIGCFLPWQLEGDVVNLITCGIQIYPSINDNGGIFILLLNIFILILLMKTPKIIKEPQKWINIFSITLVFLSFYHFGRFLLYLSDPHFEPSELGIPSLGIGLILIIIGSILLLFVLIIEFLRKRI